MPFLPPNQQCQSTEGNQSLKAITEGNHLIHTLALNEKHSVTTFREVEEMTSKKNQPQSH